MADRDGYPRPVETTAVPERGRRGLRLAWAWVLRLELPVLAIWLVAGAGLAQVTQRVVDWFVMTDELLYERLAISVAQLALAASARPRRPDPERRASSTRS